MLTFSEPVRALVESPRQPGAATAAAVCVRLAGVSHTDVLTPRGATAPFTADAPFIMYSVTKTVLATIALKLVARRSLALDQPIAHWLPRVPHATAITLRHLLRHASGLPDYGGLPAYHDAIRHGASPWSDAEYFAHTQSENLLFPPGEGWRYSNIGYMVVRQLLEAAQSAPIAAIVQAELAEPLGSNATHVVTDDAELAELTFGPSYELGAPDHPVAVAERYHVDWVAHRVVRSTVGEIAQFFAAVFTGNLLPPALLREMCTFTPLPVMPDRPFRRPGYGMGLQIDHGWLEGPIYGHSGGGPGARIAVMTLDSDQQPVTVAVAAPGEDMAQVESIAMRLLREYAVIAGSAGTQI